MDVAAVEVFGRTLQDNHADRLRDLANVIDHLVSGTTNSWSGADAERFRSWWPDKRLRMMALAEDLHGFGQSALNNASEQRDASGGWSAPAPSGSPSRGPAVPQPTDSVHGPDAGSGQRSVQVPRAWQEAQREYDAWAYGRFAAGGESHYQCTGWANFRWSQLGFDGEISGHGGEMAANAPGPTTSEPSLHAMASYRSGEYGHVMIVEEVSPDGSRIRVSEMNVGDQNYKVGRPEEYRDTRWYTRESDGAFRAHNGSALEFADFPG